MEQEESTVAPATTEEIVVDEEHGASAAGLATEQCSICYDETEEPLIHGRTLVKGQEHFSGAPQVIHPSCFFQSLTHDQTQPPTTVVTTVNFVVRGEVFMREDCLTALRALPPNADRLTWMCEVVGAPNELPLMICCTRSDATSHQASGMRISVNECDNYLPLLKQDLLGQEPAQAPEQTPTSPIYMWLFPSGFSLLYLALLLSLQIALVSYASASRCNRMCFGHRAPLAPVTGRDQL